MHKYSLLICIFLGVCVLAFPQQKFSGRVYDKKSKEPLAFVNIIYNSKNLGTTTDLNGYFTISNKDNIEFLRVSYLGYNGIKIEKQEFPAVNYIEIFLEEDAYRLDEVVILPGENPAHRIIKEVVNRSDSNNPEKMHSFSYINYSKMIFTIDVSHVEKQLKQETDSIPDNETQEEIVSENLNQPNDSISKDTAKSGIERMKEFFDSQHLFITESISQRRFRHPDNNKEEVLAHRMSGLQNPGFTLLTSQLQSFSFYDEFISLMDRRYVNPISSGSTRRYFFLIEDTMYNEKADTIFIISFRPSKDKNFDGMQGVLHINSNNYAIQNVSARPFEPKGAFDIIIQQKYEFIAETQWFPVQLNTELIMNTIQVAEDDAVVPIMGIGRSYLSDISLDPDFRRRDFNHIQIQINDDAHKKDEDFWDLFRNEALSTKDLNTYRVIDSIGKEINLDRIMDFMEIAIAGHIPYKFINFDLSKLMWYNQYEGYRLGLGIHTNDRLLPWLSLGGYFAYGFRDKAWKYGGETKFILHKASGTSLRFGYRQDVRASDSYSFNKQSNLLSNENIKHFFTHQMDSVKEYYAGIQFKTLRYLSADIKLSQTDNTITNIIRYDFLNSFDRHYMNTELGVYLRYAHKEKFFQTPKGNRLSMGTNYPIVHFNYKRGLNIFDGKYEYEKFEAQIYKKFISRWFGDTHVSITGGLTKGDLPYSELYYGEGTYSYLNVDNTFNTMRPHEFVSDRFANIHFKHDFGSLLFKIDKWQPEIAIVSSAGWGDSHMISNNSAQVYAKTMEQGYFESGIQLNNLLKINFSGYGIGVYYRYGPYSFNRSIENFAFKLTLKTVI
jgi:hypothetical protein